MVRQNRRAGDRPGEDVLGAAGELSRDSDHLKREVEAFLASVQAA
jgi:hypothetical protein